MICYSCQRAADGEQQELHCSDPYCSCQHQPRGDCIPVRETEGDFGPMTAQEAIQTEKGLAK